MKSREIQILELVLSKIEAEDSKRMIVRIRFGCPTKKTELGWGPPWWAAITVLKSLIAGMGRSSEREWRGRWGARGAGCWQWGGGRPHGGDCMGGEHRPCVVRLCCHREEEKETPLCSIEWGRREGEEREKEKEEREGNKRKEKKYGKFSNLNFFGEKNKR
jgi:hypothetical protein